MVVINEIQVNPVELVKHNKQIPYFSFRNQDGRFVCCMPLLLFITVPV